MVRGVAIRELDVLEDHPRGCVGEWRTTHPGSPSGRHQRSRKVDVQEAKGKAAGGVEKKRHFKKSFVSLHKQ